MNNVMVLGAGRGQIPIMNLCHKYGWNVIAISPKGDYPGLEIADEVSYINVKDYESVLSLAREKEISAILTDQLDAGVMTAAYVAENMGLNGITTKVAEKFTNKFIMRKAAEQIGINVPFCVCVSCVEEAEAAIKDNQILNFPLMMKPVDSAASRGVYKVQDIDHLKKKFELSKNYSKSGKVILEQFINGKEFVVEAYTHNYKVCNLVVGYREYFNIPETFIPSATIFLDSKSATDDLSIRLKETNQKLVSGFGLKFGISHAEFLYDELNDKIYLVEVAARGGGVFISSDLIPAASGVNANDLLVRDVLGLKVDESIKISKGAAAYFCYLTPVGVVSSLNGIEKVNSVSGVIKGFFDNISLGMETKLITDKSSRKGPILVSGETVEECYNVIEKVKKVIDIKVKTKEEIKDVIWG